MGPEGSIFEGKTLDDAVRKGLDALGLSRAEVMITMVEEGSSGFLGIGARPYRVRVMRRPGGPPRDVVQDDERRRGSRSGRSRGEGGRGERGGRREGGRGEGGRGEGGRGESGRGDRGRGEGGRGEGRGDGRRNGRRHERGGRPQPARPQAEQEPRARMEPGAQVSDERGGRGGRRGGRRRRDESPQGGGGGMRPQREQAPRPQRREAPVATGAQVAPEQLADEAKRVTEELFKSMGFPATVSARSEENRVLVTAAMSTGAELVTGPKGEVRQAVQHLLNLILNRGQENRYHLQLDINDFWVRREEELQELARQLADDAASSGSESVTEYLNAQERRIVHMTLREDTRVRTYALGTGLIKRVAIAPADSEAGPEPGNE